MNQARQNITTTIAYLNPRQGNRPANIKDSQGYYFTVADTGYPFVQQFVGQQVNLEFYVNAKGYNIATGINGAAIPQDPRGGQGAPAGWPQANQPPAGQPAGGPAGAPAGGQARTGVQPLQPRDKLPNYVGLAKSCIESGKTIDEFYAWVDAVGHCMSGTIPRKPAQPQPPQGGQQTPQGGAQGSGPAGPDLDDEIPF